MSRDPFTARQLAGGLLLLALIALALHVAAPREASAQTPAPPAGAVLVDCAGLAVALESIADFRDAGADLDKVLELLRKRLEGRLETPQAAVALREVRRLWAEGLPAAEAAFAFYRRCQEQQGDMGRES